MKRWVQWRSFSPEVLPVLDEVLPPPKEPWYFQTQRGALYRAVPPFKRQVSEAPDSPYGMVVVDKSADARYLRPGTKEWAAARESLR